MRDWSRMLGLALFATNLFACGAREDFGAAEPGEENIGETADPLGNTVPVAVTAMNRFLHLGPSQVLYSSGGCPETVQVRTLTGGSLSLGQFPECSISTAASDSAVFIASGGSSPRIYGWDLFQGFFSIARLSSTPRGKLLLDAQNVYFADSQGLKKVSRSGGTVFSVRAGSDVQLLALDGTLLYYRFSSELRRIHIGATSETILRNNVTGIIDLTFDSASLYWAIDQSPIDAIPDRIERMAKAGGAVSVFHNSTDPLAIADLVTASGNLYWTETLPGGASSILRRTSAGVVTVAKQNLESAAGLRAVGGFLYWNEITSGSGSTLVHELNKASLP